MIDVSTYGLYLAAFLFCVGLYVMLTKRNIIFVLIGVEIILNAAMLNLVIFSASDPTHQGQIMGIFVVVIAACESAVALAILLNIYRQYKTSDLDEVKELGR